MLKNNKSLILSALLIFIAIVIVFVVYPKMDAKNENEQISKTINVTNQYYNEHDVILGLGSDRINKVCYYAENTWLDKGNLWCEARIEKELKVTDNANDILDKLNKIKPLLNEQGFIIINESSKSIEAGIYEIQTQKDGKNCRVTIDYNDKQYPGVTPGTAAYELTYNLSCSLEMSKVPEGFRELD